MITRRNRPGISFSLVIAKVADIEKYLGKIVLAILFYFEDLFLRIVIIVA